MAGRPSTAERLDASADDSWSVKTTPCRTRPQTMSQVTHQVTQRRCNARKPMVRLQTAAAVRDKRLAFNAPQMSIAAFRFCARVANKHQTNQSLAELTAP